MFQHFNKLILTNMKKRLLSFSSLCLTLLLQAQTTNLSWATHFATASAADITSFNNGFGESIAVDSIGNVFTVGIFGDTHDFDPSASTFTLTNNGLGINSAVYISKQDANGTLIWAKILGGSITTDVPTIAIDGLGNLFITGAALPPTGALSVIKINGAGNTIWTKQFLPTTGTGNAHNKSITVDKTGNAIIVGYYYSGVDFNPHPTNTNALTATGRNAFICKLDSAGNFSWVKGIGGNLSSSLTEIYDVALDDLGNIYTSGYSNQSATSGTLNINAGGFVVKQNATGVFIYAKANGLFQGYSMAVDKHNGIYVTGQSTSSVNNYSIQKLVAQTGNIIWTKTISSSGSNAHAHCVALDSLSNLYITGFFIGSVDFDPSGSNYNLTPLGARDSYIQKMDSGGNFVSTWQFGGTNTLGQSHVVGKGIFLDKAQNIYLTGSFSGYSEVDFDPSPSNSFTLVPIGASIFVQKFQKGVITKITDSNYLFSNLSIYPNPTNGILNIDLSNFYENTTSIVITNALGQTVFTDKIFSAHSSFNIQYLVSGIYFVNISDSKGNAYSQKIIVQ